jgi:hypothetical protein
MNKQGHCRRRLNKRQDCVERLYFRSIGHNGQRVSQIDGQMVEALALFIINAETASSCI